MKLLTKFNLILIALFSAGSLLIAFTAYRFLTRNARNQVIQQAELMIESARSTRQYTANELAPLLETVPAHKTRFLPETIPFYAATGKLNLESVNFSLRESLAQAMKPLAIRAQQKGLGLNCTVDPQVVDRLAGDPVRLRQVIVNLVGNAIKFTNAGAVTVTAHKESQEGNRMTVHFIVKDTGIGIPRERQKDIFFSFTQADNSTTRKYGGTGLGLTISHRLTEMLGGRIWVESEPGRGSSFHFTARFDIAKDAKTAGETTFLQPASSSVS